MHAEKRKALSDIVDILSGVIVDYCIAKCEKKVDWTGNFKELFSVLEPALLNANVIKGKDALAALNMVQYALASFGITKVTAELKCRFTYATADENTPQPIASASAAAPQSR